MTLEKVGIRHAPLSDRIVLARFGKDPNCALESRDAMNEFLQAILSYSFKGKMPDPGESVEVTFGGGDEQFSMVVKRLPITA